MSTTNNNINYYKYSKPTQNEIKPYTGLQLSRYKNDVATKISGPVSMYLLSPTKEGYQLPVSIPIMMLFGDYHNSRDNECVDCKNDPTCYEIDTHFLSKLNVTPAALSGVFTMSPLLIQEVKDRTTIPVFTIDELMTGDSVDCFINEYAN